MFELGFPEALLSAMNKHAENAEVVLACCKFALREALAQKMFELGFPEAVLNAMNKHGENAVVVEACCRML